MRHFIHAMMLLVVLAAPALAQEGHWYLSVKGGINAGPEGTELGAAIETETGGAFLLAVGYDFARFRLEGELSGRSNDLDVAVGGKVTNGALMVNGVYEVPLTDQFTPFVLVGLGTSRIEAEVRVLDYEDDKTAFAYQAGVGVEYPMTPNLSLEVSYRFFGTEDVTFGTVDVTNTNHTGLFGLTYAF